MRNRYLKIVLGELAKHGASHKDGGGLFPLRVTRPCLCLLIARFFIDLAYEEYGRTKICWDQSVQR